MKTVGILAFGALLIVVFGYVTIFGGGANQTVVPGSDETQSVTQQNAVPKPIEREQFAGAASIRSLYERQQSLECQITYIPNPLEPEITGNIFTSDGRVRGDFVVPAPDLSGQTVASIIYDQPTLYIWSEIEGETYGVKQTQSEFAGLGDTAAAIDYDTEIQYDCLTWPRVDSTIFEPPTNVLFSDVTDIDANMEFGIMFEDENGELPL